MSAAFFFFSSRQCVADILPLALNRNEKFSVSAHQGHCKICDQGKFKVHFIPIEM